MNSDFRVSINLVHHPKIKKLIRESGYEGFYSLIRLWSFVAANKPDGILLNMDEDDIEIACGCKEQCSTMLPALLKHSLVDKIDGVYSVHDWKDHNTFAFFSPERSAKAKKAAEIRWKKKEQKQDVNARSMLPAMPLASPSNAPSPNPLPKPLPKPKPKIKEIKKEKYLSFVFLFAKEFEKLQDKFGDSLEERIETLNDYIGSTGKKYESHYYTILAWDRRNGKKEKKNGSIKSKKVDYGSIPGRDG